MVLCIVAMLVFSVMSVGSAKYKYWARQALRCVVKNLTLSPCDVGVDQMIKAKVTAKLLVVPPLARLFYRNFAVISWAFTASFFASMAYSVYSIYNFFVYGSCTPGGVCVLTWIGWCMLLIEKVLVYVVLAVLAVVVGYLLYKRIHRKASST